MVYQSIVKDELESSHPHLEIKYLGEGKGLDYEMKKLTGMSFGKFDAPKDGRYYINEDKKLAVINTESHLEKVALIYKFEQEVDFRAEDLNFITGKKIEEIDYMYRDDDKVNGRVTFNGENYKAIEMSSHGTDAANVYLIKEEQKPELKQEVKKTNSNKSRAKPF